MAGSLFVLFVADQERARSFYGALLLRPPRLDEPGMTEYGLPGGGRLGLMPRAGIEALVGEGVAAPGGSAELYLEVNDVEAMVARAVEAGATLVAPLAERSWGAEVAYLTDPDGHVLALARRVDKIGPRADEAVPVVPEAPMERAPTGGLRPTGPGWYIANLRDLPWSASPRFGAANLFDAGERFEELGLHVHRLEPGQPACLYHREDAQEGFLVLEGEVRLIVEGEERALRQWDYFHCPAGVTHVLVGGGDAPSTTLMLGARKVGINLYYPVSELAAKSGASATASTPNPSEAYGERPPRTDCDPWPQS